MKRVSLTTIAVLCLVTLGWIAGPTGSIRAEGEDPPGDESDRTEWVCPPCGMECDDTVHGEPGRCEHCGMQRVRKEEARVRHVAILLFDGVQIIDYTGPYEVFGQAHLSVYTVSRTGETLTTAMGMTVTPTYSFEDAPQPEVLVVPGGHVEDTYGDEQALDWIRRTAAGADHVMSVCNGAFILAAAGLLDGERATTFYGLIEELREFAPKTEVVTDRRFVDNGKIVTTAGLSSGIDGSLHVVDKMLGHGRAQQIALHLEYDWNPQSEFARAALADRLIPQLNTPEGSRVRVRKTEGDREHWDVVWTVENEELDLDTLDERLREQVRERGGWKQLSRKTGQGRVTTRWSFTGPSEAPWSATSVVERDDSLPGFTVRLRLERV